MKIIISGSGSFKSVFEIQVVLFLWPHPYKKAQKSLSFPSHACGVPAKPGLLSAQLIKIKVQVEKILFLSNLASQQQCLLLFHTVSPLQYN